MAYTTRIAQQSAGIRVATHRNHMVETWWGLHESWLHLENRLQPELNTLGSHQLGGMNFIGDEMMQKMKQVCVGSDRSYFRGFLVRNRSPGGFNFAFHIPHAQFQLLSQGNDFRTYCCVFFDVCGGVPVDVVIHDSSSHRVSNGQTTSITIHYP